MWEEIVQSFLDFVGNFAMQTCDNVGHLGVFVLDACRTFFNTKLKIKKVFFHINYVGVNSLSVVLLTGGAVGAVLAIESYRGLAQFGTQTFIGPLVFLSMTREFGPVLTAIMVTGRAGSAMAAELGSMRITEQIDALQTLCINIQQYLIVPRIVATTLILPFLSMFCTACGILTGYIMAVYVLKVNAEMYITAIKQIATIRDLMQGIVKAIIFGFLLSVISCYKGYFTHGGAKGVGISTTEAVVYSNVTIFMADYVISCIIKLFSST
jgi:phospholipid/cholesterol/gamma-HCH transport system permease protein